MNEYFLLLCRLGMLLQMPEMPQEYFLNHGRKKKKEKKFFCMNLSVERKALTSKTEKRFAQVVWEGEGAFPDFVREMEISEKFQLRIRYNFFYFCGRLHCAFFASMKFLSVSFGIFNYYFGDISGETWCNNALNSFVLVLNSTSVFLHKI